MRRHSTIFVRFIRESLSKEKKKIETRGKLVFNESYRILTAVNVKVRTKAITDGHFLHANISITAMRSRRPEVRIDDRLNEFRAKTN